ncbi:MAG TPA: formylglycine-generating enzyme family protein [Thermoanaerobaculia bacterium]|nr:formylglycine-generating enzyme family protein [Thermoanaerobaculia bacterium]
MRAVGSSAALRVDLAFVLLAALGCGGKGQPPAPSAGPAGAQTEIPGGTFTMGTNRGFPYEGPVHEVELGPFRLSRHEVTVGEFAAFVAATGYRTEAEKFGWSEVFDRDEHRWLRRDGAFWQEPEKPGERADARLPVTQVSWNDAVAFCRWQGGRLPTEAEFEFAARSGRSGQELAWGDQLVPAGRYLANFWQGSFPEEDTGADGFRGPAPVGSFPPNDFGLYDLVGNVWEWVSDWYAPDYYAASPRRSPQGPSEGTERAIRGGSFLCSESYCAGFRLAARSHATPDSAMNNLGFRCAS